MTIFKIITVDTNGVQTNKQTNIHNDMLSCCATKEEHVLGGVEDAGQ